MPKIKRVLLLDKNDITIVRERPIIREFIKRTGMTMKELNYIIDNQIIYDDKYYIIEDEYGCEPVEITPNKVNSSKRRTKMKNTLADLNNHLFEAIERLNDEEITGEDLSMEIKRGQIIAQLGITAVKNVDVYLKGIKMKHTLGMTDDEMPVMLENKE